MICLSSWDLWSVGKITVLGQQEDLKHECLYFYVRFKPVTHSLVPSTDVSPWVADTAPNTGSFTSIPSHAVLFNLIVIKWAEF